MHLTIEQARELLNRTGQSQLLNDVFPVQARPQGRKRASYDEANKTQIPFVASFREMEAKKLFFTVPGLTFIRLSATPQAGENNNPNDKRAKQRAIIRGQRNKALGYQKGWWDLTIIWTMNGIPEHGFIECKDEDGVVGDSQKVLHDDAKRNGHRSEVIRNRREGMLVLKKWGILPKCGESMI